MLLASHRAMQRVKTLISGQNACIIPGLPGRDDYLLARALNVPLITAGPSTLRECSTRGGAVQLLREAGLPVPENTQKTQLYKMLRPKKTGASKKDDKHAQGRGRYSDEQLASQALEDLDAHAVLCDTSSYGSWKEFYANFLVLGGLVEASLDSPPSNATTLTALMWIDGDDQRAAVCQLGRHLPSDARAPRRPAHACVEGRESVLRSWDSRIRRSGFSLAGFRDRKCAGCREPENRFFAERGPFDRFPTRDRVAAGSRERLGAVRREQVKADAAALPVEGASEASHKRRRDGPGESPGARVPLQRHDLAHELRMLQTRHVPGPLPDRKHRLQRKVEGRHARFVLVRAEKHGVSSAAPSTEDAVRLFVFHLSLIQRLSTTSSLGGESNFLPAAMFLKRYLSGIHAQAPPKPGPGFALSARARSRRNAVADLKKVRRSSKTVDVAGAVDDPAEQTLEGLLEDIGAADLANQQSVPEWRIAAEDVRKMAVAEAKKHAEEKERSWATVKVVTLRDIQRNYEESKAPTSAETKS
ncbi:MAG: hypothetical protein BJ554DRAFT_6239 [Olpidium bornovanus]|uniref:Uncharacterized protein n=1 Tax=Olpidium bornovanus TaxID=278681 RepID=A0A8H7ZY34_9FUNG|nr:MAG: hypothetical protein BJ554DRAFT_6239 [Olpidium bornovanus]